MKEHSAIPKAYESSSKAPSVAIAVGPAQARSLRAVVDDYLSLTKPKILLLLLISTACPMIVAAGSSINLKLLFWTLVGGALISGSAGAINCVWDEDIDLLMERTRDRPIPAGRVSKVSALAFSLIIGFLGLLSLAIKTNLLATSIALFGHFFYVFIYTIWLKRSTPQNIVIGGAAGAVPPIVGWVAVTGEVSLTPILLFSIIFLWTPPHFWALAINKNLDYQRAKVPMMPVVSGVRLTVMQMLAYSISLLPVSILLVLSEIKLSWFSMIFLLGLGLVFVLKNVRLFLLLEEGSEQRSKSAWDVFGFSIVYLGLFFLCLVIDSLLI